MILARPESIPESESELESTPWVRVGVGVGVSLNEHPTKIGFSINAYRGGRRLDVWGGGSVAKGPLSSLGGLFISMLYIIQSSYTYQHLIIE